MAVTQMVIGRPIDLKQSEIRQGVLQNLTSDPGSAVQGQFIWRSDTKALRVYDGTTWVTMNQSTSFGSPVASAVGDTSADGVATTAARSDHRHAREAFGAVTAQTTFGAASGNGSATTVSHSDHTHGTPATPTAAAVGAVANNGSAPGLQTGAAASKPASGQSVGNIYVDNDDGLAWIFTSATTSTQISPFAAVGAITAAGPGLSAAAGTALTYARGDHQHSTPAWGTSTTASTAADATAQGTSATYARSDHVHGREGYALVGAITTLAIGGAAAAGTATTVARGDHAHGMPGFGAVTAETTFGASSANGSASTVARSDHAHGNPTHVASDHSTIPLSAFSAATANINGGGNRATNFADPTSATDLATKQYVDGAAVGIDFKPSVQAATTGALPNTPTYANGTAGVGATLTSSTNAAFPTIDGVAAASGNRYLVKDQATAAQNGIYVLTTVGSGAAAWVLTRATDFDQSAEITAGALTYIEGGTTNGQQQWVLTTTGTVTVGTTALVFTQFSGASATTAGAGLTASGNVFAVGAGTGISVGADTVGIDTSVVARKFIQLIGDGSSTAITVNHALGNRWVLVQVVNDSTGVEEMYDAVRTDANNVTMNFLTAPASNSLRVVVIG